MEDPHATLLGFWGYQVTSLWDIYSVHTLGLAWSRPAACPSLALGSSGPGATQTSSARSWGVTATQLLMDDCGSKKLSQRHTFRLQS